VGILAVAATGIGADKDKPKPPAKDEEINPATVGAKGLDEALKRLKAQLVGGDPLPPAEAHKRLKAADGLAVDLIAHEPEVRQPLYITFDERGRMWVVQYAQYPFPAGLKIVEYDKYIRAKFDKVPPPPPNHFKGDDLVTIHEDTKGTGVFDKCTVFVSGLNIATAALPGRGGVWVLNPPYLLFYPDPDRTDKAPEKPEVHLSGFGLEDTHSVASSLRWGPDGWIYGAHGSTVTAKIKVESTGATKTIDFLGQAIWRYHPEKHEFELYAEGGGNTFGVVFDDKGRVYSGTNWGQFRGLHYVQGGYYIKGWGKHGPLTNPYALGWFEHMPHTGNADRLCHTFTVYSADTLPEQYHGRLLCPNPLQKRVQVTRLEPSLSSFKTVEEPFLLTSSDGRFRPVDLQTGPDGAVYIADLYENRINHVDPRDNWERNTGRIYRVRPAEGFKPAQPMDLAKKSSHDLLALLSHKNRWYRETALRLLGDRKDRAVIPELAKMLHDNTGQLALESLWALHLCGGLDEAAALHALDHSDANVRRWTVRLLGDEKKVTPAERDRLVKLASEEKDAEVRSQLASTAKRLLGADALPLIASLLRRSEDVRDTHIPMLLWWALEPKVGSDRDAVLKLFAEASFWKLPLVEQVILERLPQRFLLAGGEDNLLACARLLELSPGKEQSTRVLSGIEKGFAARPADRIPPALTAAIAKAWEAGATRSSLALGLRIGHRDSVDRALSLIADDKAAVDRRLECVRVLGESPQAAAVPVLLGLFKPTTSAAVQREALASLQRYNDASIAARVLELYPQGFPDKESLRDAALGLLTSRPAFARQFLAAVDTQKIAPRSVPLDVVRKLLLFADKEIVAKVEKHWGKVKASTSEEKQQEMLRLGSLLKAGKGDAKAGKLVFGNTCGKCHKLFGEGATVGPELTGYERDNLLYWLENIVDPSAQIREEYTTFIIDTTDGRLLTGLIAEQNKNSVTLKTQEGQLIRLPRERIDDLRASPISIMPEDQLKKLSETEVRDLFAYLMSKSAVK
jgi:putative membrane-bound dehydrogenase-like protein